MTHEEMMALAKRIARHKPPRQFAVEPDAAKRALVRVAAEMFADAVEERIKRDDDEFLASVGVKL